MIDLFYQNMLFIMSTEVVLPMINSRYISHNDFMVDIIRIKFKLTKILKSYHKKTLSLGFLQGMKQNMSMLSVTQTPKNLSDRQCARKGW